MSQLEVIITSGGTVSRIDDVRKIGNDSSGETGAKIAEEFLKLGAKVHFLYANKSKRPFRRNLQVDPDKLIDEEYERIKTIQTEYQEIRENLVEYEFETFEEYYDSVKGLLEETDSNAIVLAAAVSDYGCVAANGKISSDKEDLTITMEKLPKVISLIKKWKPGIFQVGFKLLADASMNELIDTAYKHGIQNHSNLTAANTMIGGDFQERKYVLITPEKGVVPSSTEELPKKLAETVERRVGTRFETKLSVGKLASFSEEISEFKKDIRKMWQLNMFEEYYSGAGVHFGFLAKRVNGGFLITGKASDKENMPDEDIVYVSNYDSANEVLSVSSLGKLASLNANVPARLFQERPDIDVIVHSHIFPGLENVCSADYAPGTKKDENEVLRYMNDGEWIVEQPNHGMIAVGSSVDNIVDGLVDLEPAYTKFPELYDLIYHRFLQSDDFLKLAETVIRHESGDRKDFPILDMATGTGEFAKSLIDAGYSDVAIADKSAAMLEIARKKFGDLTSFVKSMQNIGEGARGSVRYVFVRQAINYARDNKQLCDSLVNIRKILFRNLCGHPGGWVAFNAPNHVEGRKYRDKNLQYSVGGYDIGVSEKNLVEGNMLTHTHNCILTSKDGSEVKKVYDINRFRLFTKADFFEALKDAGYCKITFMTMKDGKLEDYNEESKSLYCAASRFL